MHTDEGKRARLVGVVRELYGMSFDHVLPFPGATCHLRVALKKFERRIHDRSAFILFPIGRADDRPRRWAGTERCLVGRSWNAQDLVVLIIWRQ